MKSLKLMFACLLITGLFLGIISSTIFYPGTKTTTFSRSDELEWREVVNLLLANSKKLEIEHCVTDARASIDEEDPMFKKILDFIESSTLKKATKKVIVIENRTCYVTIPYPYGYFLTFELRNGSKLKLNVVPEGTIWFETETTIYEVNVSSGLLEIIKGALSEAEIGLVRHEVYKEGLKLSVTLSSAELKCGETLTINAVLLNVNNTANITIAALLGGINLRIFDSQNNTVYAVKMINPGGIAPFPIFKPGHKMVSVFKWNTSENVLGGNAPPSPGKYYIEIEAYVTDLDTNSKIVLKAEMKVKLS